MNKAEPGVYRYLVQRCVGLHFANLAYQTNTNGGQKSLSTLPGWFSRSCVVTHMRLAMHGMHSHPRAWEREKITTLQQTINSKS